ncbi:F0F1 ATP synthase subunit A [Estrella lausannensis]|uniref:ATP synthase subunit a n=1 Tax=Estrella lausannensis TaxID=483423 RepID=A0A0H5DT04_9BACT|nr:F0F1 ATP synthase subunit A [Estrella lausannensis]CRX38934.1 ATP synthase subunit a [Estrella lausannensis]
MNLLLSALAYENADNDAGPSLVEQDAPVLPNLISIIHKAYHGQEWATMLFEWEDIIFATFIAIVISSFFYFGTKKKEMIPEGMQNVLEWLTESILNNILAVLGPKKEKHLPFIGTLFVYIICMNLAGLIPLMKAPSTSLNITAALALCVFFRVLYLNLKNRGVMGYLYHLAGSPKDVIGWLIVPLMLPIELLTEISRPVTLSLRLFGNIFGEEVLIGVFALFGVTAIASLNLPLGLPLQLPFMLLAIFTSFIQAVVFTLLSSIYLSLAGEGEESHH